MLDVQLPAVAEQLTITLEADEWTNRCSNIVVPSCITSHESHKFDDSSVGSVLLATDLRIATACVWHAYREQHARLCNNERNSLSNSSSERVSGVERVGGHRQKLISVLRSQPRESVERAGHV